jgi:hypothetical protein
MTAAGEMDRGDAVPGRRALSDIGERAGGELEDMSGAMVRPYTVTGGRTRPTHRLDLLSLVTPTGHADPAVLTPDHASALVLCHPVASVAEVAARMRLPVVAVKILVSDLIDYGAVAARTDQPVPTTATAVPTAGVPMGGPAVAVDLPVLEKVLDGLRQL